ncbi:hypothetical protein [Actinoplanes sp. NPDC026619]|uniref:hypothetical protein n=1 Tax=Actinoplanes sp. NPDC026619 TaxID=3155798 RepID=UPI0033C63B6E
MPLFRQQSQPLPGSLAAPPAAPAVDWSNDDRIRAEWPPGQLEGTDGGRLGWNNGMRLYEDDIAPGQLINVAEYLTRGLVYTYLGQPLMTGDQAAETVRRILWLITTMPAGGSPVLDQIAARLVRLALAVTRQKGWQPVSLGGNGRISEDLLQVPVIVEAVGAPDVRRNDNLRHFFSVAG